MNKIINKIDKVITIFVWALPECAFPALNSKISCFYSIFHSSISNFE